METNLWCDQSIEIMICVVPSKQMQKTWVSQAPQQERKMETLLWCDPRRSNELRIGKRADSANVTCVYCHDEATDPLCHLHPWRVSLKQTEMAEIHVSQSLHELDVRLCNCVCIVLSPTSESKKIGNPFRDMTTD